MVAQKAGYLRLDSVRQQRSGAGAQNFGQRVGKSSWLAELENVSIGHGVSLLCWRSGGVEHPHDEALVALLGKNAGGLSASTIGRLKEAWSEEHRRWSKRDLSAKRYVYFWVDGIHVQARLEADAQCLLVIIGATPEGKKELVADGVRESTRSGKELLLDLKRRGQSMGPELAVADGALGFWQALEEIWPQTRGQRCWVHKTANVLNKLPKSQQSKAKRALQEIWMAETKEGCAARF